MFKTIEVDKLLRYQIEANNILDTLMQQYNSILAGGTAFAISKGIQKKGVPAASFYTQPISWSFNLFKEELQKELKIDVLKYITE